MQAVPGSQFTDCLDTDSWPSEDQYLDSRHRLQLKPDVHIYSHHQDFKPHVQPALRGLYGHSHLLETTSKKDALHVQTFLSGQQPAAQQLQAMGIERPFQKFKHQLQLVQPMVKI